MPVFSGYIKISSRKGNVLDTNIKQPKLNIVSCILLIVVTGILFTCFQVFYMPHDFGNLGGKHAWVSGSTIKYVNMWLEEGAGNLHFTNMEVFPSVETPDFNDRGPYVSYPTGSTFMVWSAAKLCGRTHIDISFLKCYQLFLFGIESVFITLFAYVFCSRMSVFEEKTKIIISSLISILWMTMPVNNWFLANIFWTDMAVIFWVILYVLLEGMSDWEALSEKQRRIVHICRFLVIIAGVLTEYFFYIVVFGGFVLNIFYELNKKEENKGKRVIKTSLEYVIPVLLAVMIFVWQMSYTSDWAEQLVNTFLHRTGAVESENISGMFWRNFQNVMADNSKKRALLLFGVEAVLIIGFFVNMIRNKSSELLSNKSLMACALLVVTPVVQILLFWNHSSIHMYSMVKIGLQIIGVLLGIIALCTKLISNEKLKMKAELAIFACSFVCVLISLGYPGRVKGLYEEKNSVLDYSIDRVIQENTDYNDVCFSYTYLISNNPPMDICVSEKMVYLIENEEEIDEMFPNLPTSASKVLLIDKTGNGSNAYEKVEKDDVINAAEQKACEEGKIVYEDGDCVLVRMQAE